MTEKKQKKEPAFTVRLPQEVRIPAKNRANSEGTTLKEVVTEFLRRWGSGATSEAPGEIPTTIDSQISRLDGRLTDAVHEIAELARRMHNRIQELENNLAEGLLRSTNDSVVRAIEKHSEATEDSGTQHRDPRSGKKKAG